MSFVRVSEIATTNGWRVYEIRILLGRPYFIAHSLAARPRAQCAIQKHIDTLRTREQQLRTRRAIKSERCSALLFNYHTANNSFVIYHLGAPHIHIHTSKHRIHARTERRGKICIIYLNFFYGSNIWGELIFQSGPPRWRRDNCDVARCEG